LKLTTQANSPLDMISGVDSPPMEDRLILTSTQFFTSR
jgi:hypothetical protein